MRLAQHLLEVRLVDLVRQDGRALGDERPQPARVVEVAVRVDDVSNRLVRNQPLGFGDHRQRPRLALPALDEGDVVLEVHGDHGVAARDQVHAVAELLGYGRRIRRRRRGRRRSATARGWRLNRDGRVHLHVAQGQVEDRIPTLPLHDVHRELHAVHVLVVR